MSQSSSLPKQPIQEQFEAFDLTPPGTPAWKQEVNQRLAAHRTRRGGAQAATDGPDAQSPRSASGRAAAAAARVAERYAKAPSYSQLLAGEARAVVRAAGAAAEAARDAQAAAQAVLAGLESGTESGSFWEAEPTAVVGQGQPAAQPARWLDEPPVVEETVRTPWVGAQPRWEEALPVTTPASARRSEVGRAEPAPDVWSEMRVHPLPQAHHERYQADEAEGLLWDEAQGAMVEPVQHLPANLIEFPRELVATRKARPRLAEGPYYAAAESPQLSIFEVDPELLAPPIYLHPNSENAVTPPNWASIELEHSREHAYDEREHAYEVAAHDAPVAGYAAAVEEYAAPVVQEQVQARVVAKPAGKVAARPVAAPVELRVASVSDRVLAGLVDGGLISLAFLAAAVVVIASAEHPPMGKMAIFAGTVGLVLFTALYQYLFLSYAEEGTPGMRYARIALCTFEDENPTKEQMQMRIPAMLVATLPLGIGLAWAMLDGERLGWHDRLTRTYQRKY